jgi:hypothetical protein
MFFSQPLPLLLVCLFLPSFLPSWICVSPVLRWCSIPPPSICLQKQRFMLSLPFHLSLYILVSNPSSSSNLCLLPFSPISKEYSTHLNNIPEDLLWPTAFLRWMHQSSDSGALVFSHSLPAAMYSGLSKVGSCFQGISILWEHSGLLIELGA